VKQPHLAHSQRGSREFARRRNAACLARVDVLLTAQLGGSSLRRRAADSPKLLPGYAKSVQDCGVRSRVMTFICSLASVSTVRPTVWVAPLKELWTKGPNAG
jgi:hypothetical protein